MALIEDYLNAIRFWLPRKGQQDILNELAEDIRAEIEARQAALGHELTDGEIAGLLKERGRPVLVANAYLPQRYLIGPVLFPVYVFVLKIVGVCYLLLFVLASLVALLNPVHPVLHASWYWITGAAASWALMWRAALSAFAVTTLVFALLERRADKAQLFEHWDPTHSLKLHDPIRIQRRTASFDLAVDVVVLAWWAVKMGPVLFIDQPGVQVLLTPSWHLFFWGFLAVLVAHTTVAAGNVMRPYWTLPRATVRLAIDLAGAALFCWLMKAHIVGAIYIAQIQPDRSVELVNAINAGMAQLLPVVIVVNLAIVGFDIRRILGVRGLRGAGSRMASA